MAKATTLNRMFALDIGTRTVVGVLARGDTYGRGLDVIDIEVAEHRERSVFGGQIHDIASVAEIVKEVKQRLEQRNNCSLNHVCVAAAGRTLITQRIKTMENVEGLGSVGADFINSLELKAMQAAQERIQRDYRGKTQHYCVGYSVANYYLDGIPIKNLEGHQGYEMGVDIIATFLPRTVVESLYTVMERSGLEIINLTLEPIAAMGITIPENLRALNLAMVDIGAGTSDIAISRDGSIYAYSMVSMAGDSVTEEIAQRFLLDFQTAEGLKKCLFLGEQPSTCRKDIMGDTLNISLEQLTKVVQPVINRISDEIIKNILKYNEGPPKALFCVGGGSLTPGLKECIALKLGLPKDRAGIKEIEDSELFRISVPGISGPEFITPIGIALAGYKASGDHFLDIRVNDEELRLLNIRNITVGDALMAAGFSPRKLIPARGRDINFFINGTINTIKGEPGDAAIIKVNGEGASLDTTLKKGDVLRVTEATTGKDACPKVADILQRERRFVTLGGERVMLPMEWTLNNVKTSTSDRVCEGDNLEIIGAKTLGELIIALDLPDKDYIYDVNGQEVTPSYILEDMDIINFYKRKPKGVITVTVNGKSLKLPPRRRPYMFIDVFNFLDLNPKGFKGRVNITINGEKAGYTDIIKDGDSLVLLQDGGQGGERVRQVPTLTKGREMSLPRDDE